MSPRIDHIESNDFLMRSICSGVIDRIAAIYAAKSLIKPSHETAAHAMAIIAIRSSCVKNRVPRYATPAETARHPHRGLTS
jgi:hypothetical protein